MKTIRCIQLLVWLALGTTVARAAMTLTPAGIGEGLSLSTFATNFPSVGGVGPEGITFTSNGVMVADGPGNVRVFPSHADGQNAAAVPPTAVYAEGDAIGLAELGGKFYMTQRTSGRVLQVNADGTFSQVIVSNLATATGIVSDPFTGHLFVSELDSFDIFEVNPIAKTAVQFKHVNADGLALSSDGRTLYAALNGLYIYGYDTVTKAQVFVSGLIGNVDGIALGNGTLAGKIYANTNFGELWEVDLTTTNQTLIASGGSRGDFVTPDPTDGTLLVTQTDRILRLHPPPGGGFGNGPCVTPPAGLVSWWPGDGTANDIIGNNVGSLNNGATFAAGLVDQAFSFDGGGASVSVADAASLHVTAAFTLDAWVKPVQHANSPMVVSKFGGSGSSYELHLVPGGGLRANISGDGTTLDFLVSSPGLIPTGTWSHVATTFDVGAWTLYVNGTAVTSKTSAVTSVFPGTDTLFIGRDAGTTHSFDGLIDEVEFFNRALSAGEIRSIVSAGVVGKCKQASTDNAPVAHCQNVTTNANANCIQDVPASAVNDNSTDPDGDPLTFSLSPPGPYATGITFVTLTVADNNGGTNTCQATVTVLDQTPPTIVCPADIVVPTAPGLCSSNVSFTVNTSDNCPGGSVVSVPASGSTFNKGTNIVVSTVMDAAGNTNSCSFLVIVNDLQAPAITCPQDITASAAVGQTDAVVNFSTPTATDNCPGVSVVCVPASGTSFALGTNTVTCTATDTSSNSSNCTFNVIVTEAPPTPHDLAVIQLKAPKNINLQGAEPSLTKFASVTFVNLSDHSENITTYNGLVTLAGQSLGTNCPNLAIVLHPGPPNKVLPLVLGPKKKLTVRFDVTYTCANDSDKGEGHEDFRFIATVNHAALDGNADTIPVNDTCPRPPSGADKGCGGKDKATGQAGADVVTDVFIK